MRGIEVLYSKRDNGAGFTNKQLAAKLLKKTVAATGLPARGVIRREDLYLMHHAKVPAVIVETGYLTNPSDCLYMQAGKRNKADRLGNLSGSDGDIREILERLSRNGTFVSLILERNQ